MPCCGTRPSLADQREFVETIHSSGWTLLKLINDILDFSKIEAGKLALEVIPFDPARVLREVAELLGPQTRQKQLALRSHSDPSVPDQIVGDPVRMRQVMLNLAGNAVKFTRWGGVSIELRLDPDRPEFLRCEVTDTGIGIPPEKQPLLFRKFSQVDSSTTRRFGGTGLGLAISKRLIELMGGEIGLQSEPGKGSTFWFILPTVGGLNPKAPAAPPPLPVAERFGAGPSPEPRGEPRFHVLLAEDDETNQRLAVQMLQHLGCRVDVASNGAEAAAMAAQLTYDAIFMDCMMPEMNGWEATRVIRRAEHGNRRVPIVAVTADVMPGQREKCLEAGMDDFVEKPIDFNALAQILTHRATKGARDNQGQG